jgi:hypothetical protein
MLINNIEVKKGMNFLHTRRLKSGDRHEIISIGTKYVTFKRSHVFTPEKVELDQFPALVHKFIPSNVDVDAAYLEHVKFILNKAFGGKYDLGDVYYDIKDDYEDPYDNYYESCCSCDHD